MSRGSSDGGVDVAGGVRVGRLAHGDGAGVLGGGNTGSVADCAIAGSLIASHRRRVCGPVRVAWVAVAVALVVDVAAATDRGAVAVVPRIGADVPILIITTIPNPTIPITVATTIIMINMITIFIVVVVCRHKQRRRTEAVAMARSVQRTALVQRSAAVTFRRAVSSSAISTGIIDVTTTRGTAAPTNASFTIRDRAIAARSPAGTTFGVGDSSLSLASSNLTSPASSSLSLTSSSSLTSLASLGITSNSLTSNSDSSLGLASSSLTSSSSLTLSGLGITGRRLSYASQRLGCAGGGLACGNINSGNVADMTDGITNSGSIASSGTSGLISLGNGSGKTIWAMKTVCAL